MKTHRLAMIFAVRGTAVPPPPQAGQALRAVPLQVAQPASPSLQRVQTHST